VKGDRLLAQHHVARHCRRNDLFWLGATPTAVQESALLDPDPDGVSVTWLEHFGGDRQHQIAEVRRHVTLRIKPRQSNRLAILNVGNVENMGRATGVHVIEDPITDPPPNPAHALIKDAAALQSQLIRAAIAATVQPGDIEAY
jgi:hypothetical protein